MSTPSNPLLNPLAAADPVTEYDIRTLNGSVIGIASAVGGGSGLLPLGALMPSASQDVQLSALSGPNLLGMARIRSVTIKSGARVNYVAPLRKPLILVGATVPPEQAGGTAGAVQILDPLSSIDIVRSSGGSVTVAGGMSAGAATWDGRFVLVAQGATLAVFDTGAGQTVAGTLALPFSPSRLAVAPRDTAAVALDAGNGTDGNLALFSDVAGLTTSPGAAMPKMFRLGSNAPRAVAFAPDGSRIYVLAGNATADPCSPGAPTAGNNILILGSDGTMLGSYTLPSFVSDLAVDGESGNLILAEAHRLSQLPPSLGSSPASAVPVTPTKLLDNLNCPSAVRVSNGVVFAVTSDRDGNQANAFILRRFTLKTGQSSAVPFGGPQFVVPIQSMASPDGNIMMVDLPIRPVLIWAYELAITPDSSRAEFATRARYYEQNVPFSFYGESCVASFDIAEYGLYALDLRTGNASYAMRSQVLLPPLNGHGCVTCSVPLGGQQVVDCTAYVGDKPSGLSAVFGQ